MSSLQAVTVLLFLCYPVETSAKGHEGTKLHSRCWFVAWLNRDQSGRGGGVTLHFWFIRLTACSMNLSEDCGYKAANGIKTCFLLLLLLCVLLLLLPVLLAPLTITQIRERIGHEQTKIMKEKQRKKRTTPFRVCYLYMYVCRLIEVVETMSWAVSSRWDSCSLVSHSLPSPLPQHPPPPAPTLFAHPITTRAND